MGFGANHRKSFPGNDLTHVPIWGGGGRVPHARLGGCLKTEPARESPTGRLQHAHFEEFPLCEPLLDGTFCPAMQGVCPPHPYLQGHPLYKGEKHQELFGN